MSWIDLVRLVLAELIIKFAFKIAPNKHVDKLSIMQLILSYERRNYR